MADETVLTTELREKTGSAEARRVRRSGRVPAVLYGHKQETVHLSLDGDQVRHVLVQGQQVVDLQIGGETQKALVKEVQHDVITDACLHLDLARVALDERVEVDIPIELVGTPTEAEGNVLSQLLHELHVECLAIAIPENFRVRVTDMTVGDSISVSDLEVPEGVTVLNDADATVVQLTEAVAEEEEEVEEEGEPGADEPEVIGAKKDEEDEEEA